MASCTGSSVRRMAASTALALMLASGLHTAARAASTAEKPAGEQVAIRPVVSIIVTSLGAQAATYYGQVTARIIADLGFAQAGELLERPVRRGDIVAAGDLLAALDPTDLNARLRAAEAQYDMAKAQVALASDAEARTRELAARGTANSVQLDSAKLARVAADASLNQASAGLASVRDLLATSHLVAPDAGAVLATYAEPGSNLAAGKPVVQLAALKGREVLIDLTETELAQLAPDARFQVALDANPSILTEATIASVDPVADKATRTRRVHLGLATPPEQFRIGALARVTQLADASQAAQLIIPASALLAENDATYVWRVDRPSGRVSRIKVTTDAATNGQVRLRDGVAKGDEIVIRGIHSLTEGQIVGPQVAP